MKNKLTFSELIHDTDHQQFRMSVNGEIMKVDYRMRDNMMQLVHSEVPYHLRGQGLGKIIVEKVFEYIDVNKLNATAVCSFIAAVAQENSKWKEVIS